MPTEAVIELGRAFSIIADEERRGNKLRWFGVPRNQIMLIPADPKHPMIPYHDQSPALIRVLRDHL